MEMVELLPGFAEIFMKFGAVPILFGFLMYRIWELSRRLAKTEEKLERYYTEDKQKMMDALTQSSRVIEQNNKILENLLIKQ